MLAWLAQQLAEWESGFSVFQYITLRGILSAMTALIISTLIGFDGHIGLGLRWIDFHYKAHACTINIQRAHDA